MEIMKYALNIRMIVFFPIALHLQEINTANILAIFPYPAKSHFIFNNALMKSLSDTGHQVTIITSFPRDITLENFTLIDTSKDFLIQVENTTYNQFTGYTAYSITDVAFHQEKPTCDKFWQLEQIQNIMNSSEKLFDVVFVEIFHLYKCFLPVARKLGVPVIGTMSFKSWIPADLAIGNPNNPAYVPYETSISWNQDSFIDRLRNLWCHLVVHYYRYSVTFPFLQQFHKDHLSNFISYRDYIDMEPSLIFYNTHHTYLHRPMNKNAIEIAGIHIKPSKPLPQNIREFIEGAQYGVILFSFGSLVKASTLPPKILSAFLDAFAEIPQRVIIKYEDELLDAPSNVLSLKWVPQRDILEHKNVKAFISHCGQGGVYEAIHTATPIVSCPLMFDQPSNAALLVRSGVAIRLDIESVTKHNILKALNAIINDTRYQDNMNRLSDAFKNRPMTPQQSVVYWTEYVLKYHGRYLEPASSSFNYFQYLLLDVISFLILLSLVFAILIIFSVKLFLIYYARIYARLLANFKYKSA